MTELEQSYKKFVDKGFVVIPTKSNTKFIVGGGAYSERQTMPFSPHATGFAIVLPKSYISVDIDVSGDKVGRESYTQLLVDLGLPYVPEPTTLTQSGGEHIFFENKYPEKVIGSELKKIYKHVDIFAGHQTVHPIPCTEYKNDEGEMKRYEWANFSEEVIINPWHDSLETILQLTDRGEVNTSGTYDPMELLEKAEDMPDAEVDKLLKSIGYNTHHDTWIEIGMAVYDRYGGGDEGRTKWVAFCEASPKANTSKSTGADKWDKGQLLPDKITYKRLRYIANDETNVPMMMKRIEEAKTKDDFDVIAEDVATTHNWATLSKNTKEVIEDFAEVWRQARKDTRVDSRLMQLGTAVACFDPIVVEAEALMNGESRWTDDIVLIDSVKGTQRYYIKSEGVYYSGEALEMIYHKELQTLGYKRKTKAKTFKAVTHGLIEVMAYPEYNPLSDEQVITKGSKVQILNTFDPSTKPPVATEYTEIGRELVDAFVKHMHFIMSDDEATIFLDMLAWQVQNFGKKMLWSPMIQSTQGIGKTVIGSTIINHLFGQENAGVIDPTVLLSENNSWACRGVMSILEEVKIAGHNRHEILNRLKPIITNPKISRVEKYEVSQEVNNFMNIIAFTNYKDAIPAEGNDRRWWIVYSRMPNLKQLELETGKGVDEYFTPLHALKDADSPHGAELKKYFMERDISNFKPNFLPPSVHKDRAVAGEESVHEHLSEVRELIELPKHYKGITEEVVSTRQLRDALETLNDDDLTNMHSKALTLLLVKLEYEKLPKKISYKGIKHSVWTRMTGAQQTTVDKIFRDSMDNDIKIATMQPIEEE